MTPDEAAEFEGELPADSIQVRRYDIGYGRISYVNEEGGSALPVVTLQPEGGPLLFFSAPDALTVSQHMEQAGLRGLRQWDPELAKMPSPMEVLQSQIEMQARWVQRQRVILLGWLLSVVIASVIVLVAGEPVWRGLEGALWIPGVIWVTEVVTIWTTEWKLKRKERRAAAIAKKRGQ